MEKLDWIERAAIENLTRRVQNADAVHKEANTLLALLLSGGGADRELRWDAAAGYDRLCSHQFWSPGNWSDPCAKSLAGSETGTVAVLASRALIKFASELRQENFIPPEASAPLAVFYRRLQHECLRRCSVAA